MSREISLGAKPTLLEMLESVQKDLRDPSNIILVRRGSHIFDNVLICLKKGRLLSEKFNEHDLEGT